MAIKPLLVFTVIARILVFKSAVIMGVGVGLVKMSYKIQHFFLNKHSSGCCRLLVKFQSSGKVDSDSFCQYFYGRASFALFAFLEDLLFRGPYSAIPADITPV